MNFKRDLGELIASLNKGFVKETIEIKHKYKKNLSKVLYLLTKEGIIHGFKVEKNEKYFNIYLKLDNKQKTTTKLILNSKVSNIKYISEYKLKSLIYKDFSTLIITTTTKGLIVNNKNIAGGEFLLKIKI